MHRMKIGIRIDLMFLHQTGQGGAVRAPVVFAQVVRFCPVNAQLAHHILGHLDLDLIEQSGRGRIKRVVQVKDPVSDMREEGFYHAFRLGPGGRFCNPAWPISCLPGLRDFGANCPMGLIGCRRTVEKTGCTKLENP